MHNPFKLAFSTLAAAGLLVPALLFADPPAPTMNGAGSSLAVAAVPASPVALPATGAVPAVAPPAAIPKANSDDHVLMPGDLIEVKVFQEPDLDTTMRVARDGSVVYPLIDRVTVGGLTPLTASKLIHDLLDKDYIVNPQVSLLVMEYAKRTFTVLGEVQKPGSYDMPDRATVSLLEAIGMSGGYTRVANPNSVTVKRRVKNREMVYRLNAKKMAASGGSPSSFEIKADDVITVAESIF